MLKYPGNKLMEVLGIKYCERFRILDSDNVLTNDIYYITADFTIYKNDCASHDLTIVEILKGDVHVVSINDAVIEYARACGYNYLAVDKDGTAYAFKDKPKKSGDNYTGGYDHMKIECKVNFISWDDKPYQILSKI